MHIRDMRQLKKMIVIENQTTRRPFPTLTVMGRAVNYRDSRSHVQYNT